MRTAGRPQGRRITIYILRALAHHALGNQEVAIDRMGSAVQLAAPEGYLRAFLDEGPVVAELLPHARDTASAFVDGLFQAFADEGRRTDDERSVSKNDAVAEAGASEAPSLRLSVSLPEPLSDRELQVLRLLADGQSNAEIARALVVAVGTAKWHVHNLLEKLGVENRTQAVTRARELKLL